MSTPIFGQIRLPSFTQPHFRAGIQVSCWGLLTGALLLLSYQLPAPAGFRWRIALIFPAGLSAVCANVYWFFPRYLKHRRLARYLWGFTGFCFVYLITTLTFEFWLIPTLQLPLDLPPDSAVYRRMKALGLFPQLFIRSAFLALAALGAVVFETLYLQGQLERKRARSQAEKAALEMRFLKSQVNPHFLLNALNNIYGLARVADTRTPEVVLKLADMLKYSLYKTKAVRIPLREEVTYLQNFIAFQQIKQEEEMNVVLELELPEETVFISPMVLLPLVENAFKHGNPEELREGWVTLQLWAKPGLIVFNVINSINSEETKVSSIKEQGIGLVNVRRQLALHYPDQHSLKVHKTDTTFAVTLRLLA